MKKLLLVFLFVSLVSCSTEDNSETVTPTTQQPVAEPEPTVIKQYTLTVTASEGGSVTAGGTYDEGTDVSITATPAEGYEFIDWEGNSETTNSFTLTIDSDTVLMANFQLIPVTVDYYSSGEIIYSDDISQWFDRYLDVYGIRLLIAGEVGGQESVPDKWAYKTAQVIKMLIDKTAEGINLAAQENMIKILKGEIGFNQGYPVGQRIGYGGGDTYSPSPLTDSGRAQYEGLDALQDAMALDDMVWYKNISSQFTGDDDINEILEHILHTLHMLGVRGAVEGSFTSLNMDAENDDISETEIFLAMKQAMNNSLFAPEYGNINISDSWPLLLKEYQYLLSFGMWEFSEFWEDGTLAPEWNDVMKTPQGILENNPLGYALFNTYYAPVISKPSIESLRLIFQDNDGGESGYIAD
jgi:hypothetical protein